MNRTLVILISVFSQALAASGQFDPGVDGGFVDYLEKGIATSAALQSSLSPQAKLEFALELQAWRSDGCEVISRGEQHLGEEQYLEIFFVQFGDDDFRMFLIQCDRSQGDSRFYSVQNRSLMSGIEDSLSPYDPYLPDYQPDKTLVVELSQLVNEATTARTLDSLFDFDMQLMEEIQKPMDLLRHRKEQLGRDDRIFQLVEFVGEAKLISAKKITDDIFSLAFYQDTSWAPAVQLFYFYQTEEGYFMIGRSFVVGTPVLPYLRRASAE